jgi:outer membrane protein assembly factor BamB
VSALEDGYTRRMVRSRLLVSILVWVIAGGIAVQADSWPRWRGPLATGEAPEGNPPVTWSEELNVAWKVSVPGKGLSSPIVHGGRVFVTTAEAFGHPLESPEHEHEYDDGAHDNVVPDRRMRFDVLAYDVDDGALVWSTTVRTEQPHEAAHVTGSWASPSAITDGKRLYASFGSRGLYALDLDGKVLWERDLGDMRVRHAHGEGSSPALRGDTLVVNWDHQGDSFLVALDTATGKTKWKTERDEITSWSSPLIVPVGDRVQVVVAATDRVRGYDLEDGSPIWECEGLSRNVVATPVATDGLVIVANSYDGKKMMAIRLAGARGDITGTEHVVWERDRDTPYVPSPVLHEGRLYFLKHSHGFLTAVEAATGKTLFGPVRLGPVRNVFASPVVAAGRIYIPSRDGATLVAEAGTVFKTLAVNELDDSFSASPAVAGDALFLRGDRHLYKIAADQAPVSSAP